MTPNIINYETASYILCLVILNAYSEWNTNNCVQPTSISPFHSRRQQKELVSTVNMTHVLQELLNDELITLSILAQSRNIMTL